MGSVYQQPGDRGNNSSPLAYDAVMLLAEATYVHIMRNRPSLCVVRCIASGHGFSDNCRTSKYPPAKPVALKL
jgi:hypothetical protein